MTDLEVLEDADRRARRYVAGAGERRVYPDGDALAELSAFDEPLPEIGRGPRETLELLDDIGSPGTVVSNGPNYFGFVIGGALPAAAVAERMMTAWDQCASSFDNSPVADVIEKTAARWILDALDLPRGSAVSFGTSASAGGLACLTAARRSLLARQGWDFDADGLVGAPEIRVVVPDSVHITIRKALRLMGFGTRHLVLAPTDGQGRIDPARLPALDSRSILCLQAGEVNTGSFDPFAEIMGLVVSVHQHRMGVGRALVERAMAWADSRGIGDLRAEVQLHREAAHDFFESLGFELSEERQVWRRVAQGVELDGHITLVD